MVPMAKHRIYGLSEVTIEKQEVKSLKIIQGHQAFSKGLALFYAHFLDEKRSERYLT